MGAHIKDENNQFLIVAEVEDLSLAFGGAFTARAGWLGSSLLTLLVFWWLAARVTSNIRNLTQAAEKFGAGDYGANYCRR